MKRPMSTWKPTNTKNKQNICDEKMINAAWQYQQKKGQQAKERNERTVCEKKRASERACEERVRGRAKGRRSVKNETTSAAAAKAVKI